MGIPAGIGPIMEFVNKVWDFIGNRPKKRLEKRRQEIVDNIVRAQFNGDLDALRINRAKLDDIDRRLSIGDY